MQDDIRPSKKGPKDVQRQPMKGMRLRGQNADASKDRIAPGSVVKKVTAPVKVKEAPVLSEHPAHEYPGIADNSFHPAPPEPEEIETINEADTKPPKGPSKFAKLAFWRNWKSWSKKKKALFIVIVVLVVALIAGGVYALVFKKDPVVSTTKPKKAATVIKSNTVASPLSGLQVAPELAARPVTGIMIENSVPARPQSGLQDAGVVYEAVAEAGITRFLALFQDSTPQYIGPVRSLRPYYIDFAAPFQASIVHVGGSPDALKTVSDGNYRNLDQFANGSFFTRITAKDAPHNVFTSFALLDKLNQSKGYTTSKFTSWPRKNDAKVATPTAKTVDLTMSGADYNVHYDYLPATNNYNRSEGGAGHIDYVNAADKTGVQLRPKVVVAMVMPLSNGALDASGAFYSNYNDIGTGVVDVFQDGTVTQGTWTKSGTASQVEFTDAGGHPLKFDAGQTWITVVDSAAKVAYKP